MSDTDTITIKLFAGIRQQAGVDQLQLKLSRDARISDVRELLSAQFPESAPLLSRCLFSINAEYATDDVLIPADAELACIPPVSGG